MVNKRAFTDNVSRVYITWLYILATWTYQVCMVCATINIHHVHDVTTPSAVCPALAVVVVVAVVGGCTVTKLEPKYRNRVR
jgi:hypothetical protein